MLKIIQELETCVKCKRKKKKKQEKSIIDRLRCWMTCFSMIVRVLSLQYFFFLLFISRFFFSLVFAPARFFIKNKSLGKACKFDRRVLLFNSQRSATLDYPPSIYVYESHFAGFMFDRQTSNLSTKLLCCLPNAPHPNASGSEISSLQATKKKKLQKKKLGNNA